MLAALQDKPGGPVTIQEIEKPKPGPGEVLVKMSFAPINPSDLSMLRGTYSRPPYYPFTPGIEGSGVVVESGKGVMARIRHEKKVACTSVSGKGGTWAEYMVTKAMNTIPLGNTALEQGSMMIVNPLTAVSLLGIIKAGQHTAIAQNAAGGALGRMINNLCRKNSITVINIVRSMEQAQELEKSGFTGVLCSSDKDFTGKLTRMASDTGARFFLDAVGGDQTRKLAEAAPHGSTIMLYAKLSEEDFNMDSRTILTGDKIITGFSLPIASSKKNLIRLLGDIRKVKSLIGEELETGIRSIFPLQEINNALENYRARMSGGKILIRL